MADYDQKKVWLLAISNKLRLDSTHHHYLKARSACKSPNFLQNGNTNDSTPLYIELAKTI
jgi:hypothetical protein